MTIRQTSNEEDSAQDAISSSGTPGSQSRFSTPASGISNGGGAIQGSLIADRGARFSAGKTRWDLLPGFGALSEVANVATFGALKYDDDNWRKGLSYRDCFRAALSHLFKWFCGEERDPESGCLHVAHAAWNCMVLVEFALAGATGHDDRPKRDDLIVAPIQGTENVREPPRKLREEKPKDVALAGKRVGVSPLMDGVLVKPLGPEEFPVGTRVRVKPKAERDNKEFPEYDGVEFVVTGTTTGQMSLGGEGNGKDASLKVVKGNQNNRTGAYGYWAPWDVLERVLPSCGVAGCVATGTHAHGDVRLRAEVFPSATCRHERKEPHEHYGSRCLDCGALVGGVAP